MASVHDGLSMADETVETVSPDDAFAASLEAKMRGETPAQAPAPEEAPAPQRDPSTGRFVAAAPTVTPDEADETPSQEPDFEARLREKDAFIGRQSNEIGELRARLEALETAQQQPEEAPQPTFISVEQAEQIVERAGPEGAVMAAIQDGIHPDNPVFKTIFETAAESCETQAQLADLVELRLRWRQEVEQGEQEPPAPAQSADDPALKWAQEQYRKQVVEAAVSELRANTPDFDALAPYFEKALEVSPLLKPEIESGDPQRMSAALSTLLHVARGVQVASGAAGAGAQSAAQQAAVAMRQAAQVATSGLRPVSPDPQQPQEGSTADQVAEFKKRFRETLSPTIQDGLTIG